MHYRLSDRMTKVMTDKRRLKPKAKLTEKDPRIKTKTTGVFTYKGFGQAVAAKMLPGRPEFTIKDKLTQGAKRILNKKLWLKMIRKIFAEQGYADNNTRRLCLVKGKNIKKEEHNLLKPLYCLNFKGFKGYREFLSKEFLINTTRNFVKNKAAIVIASCLIAVVLMAAVGNQDKVQAYYNVQEQMTGAYEVSLGENHLGIVSDKEQVLKLIKDIKDGFQQQYGTEAVISQDMNIKPVSVGKIELTSEQELEENIKAVIDIKVNGAAIVVDGETIAIVKNKQAAEQIIDNIKKPYIEAVKGAENEIKDVSIVEDIEIKNIPVEYSNIQDEDKAYKKIALGTDDIKEYSIKEGDSLWSIARENDMRVDDLKKANPRLLDSELIKPGEKIKLVIPKSIISVKTVEVIEYIDSIPYEKQVKQTSDMYKNESKVLKKGEDGQKQVVAEVEKHNGVEVARKIISEKVVEQPVTEIVAEGTKPLPPKKGTGILGMPARGRITSRFGPRWGGFHKGVDIAAPVGTPIYASDGGVVIQAGWSGGYGRMILIDHGGGIKTRYAHCSRLLVSSGGRVRKGQLIAKMGSTGNSTGPHVHFEVIKNGRPVNPLTNLK